jgi:ribonuclease T2
MKRLWIAAAIAALPAAALAAPSCTAPPSLAIPHAEEPSAREPQRLLPIGSYTLSLIWLPQSCRRGERSTLDCAAQAGRNGFVLHGLWPDGRGREWPQWCAAAAPLPAATLAAHYCATPSVQLTQHEWAKHGTCMPGYDPDRYLSRSRALFADLRLPNLRALSFRQPTARAVRAAFAAANRGMSADMVRLNVNRDGWLEEVWVCLDKAFNRRICPADAGGPKPGDRVKIWRGQGRAA